MSLDLGGPERLSLPIGNAGDLIALLRSAEKPRGKWRVGVEHEKIGMLRGREPIPYDGPAGIRALLESIASASGGAWAPHEEEGKPIALLRPMASVSLEPGGQLELSGAPFAKLSDARAEIAKHLQEVSAASAPLGIEWLAAGYRPYGTAATSPWMPKMRYQMMRRTLGPQGRLAMDMMLMTATVQANLDWSDEEDLAKKVRAATSASPVVSAIFANSPITEGRAAGVLDYRYQVWRETDPARCGLLESMARPGWGYRSYVDWALDVPLLFVRHDGHYLDAGGQTFRQWMAKGEAAGLRGQPRLQNWVEHLTTLFPEVRVKSVLELRGADVVPPPLLMALPALWVGLLYDEEARQGAIALTERWTFAERLEFQAAVVKSALSAKGPGGATAQDLAKQVLSLARSGLARWAKVSGADDGALLDPAAEIAESGVTLAERVLLEWEAADRDPRVLSRLWRVA